MKLHREGKGTLAVVFLALVILNSLVQWATDLAWLEFSVLALSVVLYAIVVQFFRNPTRTITINPKGMLCPADGKVVTIQEVFEDEILKGQVYSNVHFHVAVQCARKPLPIRRYRDRCHSPPGQIPSGMAPEELHVERTYHGSRRK
jgi:hypothetical protein